VLSAEATPFPSRGIRPSIRPLSNPVIEKSKRADGTLSREDFVFDLKTDTGGN